MSPAADLLHRWLDRRLDPGARERWSALQRRAALGGLTDWTLAVALVPRQLGKDPLDLDAPDRRAADAARPGWQPALRIDQAARLLLILGDEAAGEVVQQRLETLGRSADLAESITIAHGLPLYPDPERYRARAAESVRSNMRDLFIAVAQHNPYPSEQFDQGAWNQMVLKALFIELSLDPIIGLDQRRNADLARMLEDYAAERRAASRSISPELWRCVGSHASERGLELLGWVLGSGSERERDAAALALHEAGPRGASILATDPKRAEAAAQGRLRWGDLA